MVFIHYSLNLYASPNVTDFRDSFFSFHVTKAETGTLSTYAILVVKQCQQQIDDFLLFRPSATEWDGSNCSNVGVRIIQQLEQGIYNSWWLKFTYREDKCKYLCMYIFNSLYTTTELKLIVCHRPFSNPLQSIAEWSLIWQDKFTIRFHFNRGVINNL